MAFVTFIAIPALVLSFVAYCIACIIGEYWDRAETKKQFIIGAIVPYYYWVKMFIELYNNLPKDKK